MAAVSQANIPVINLTSRMVDQGRHACLTLLLNVSAEESWTPWRGRAYYRSFLESIGVDCGDMNTAKEWHSRVGLGAEFDMSLVDIEHMPSA